VARLTKFLADRGFIVTRREPSGNQSCASEPVYTQDRSWPQKRRVVTRKRVTAHILFKYQMPNYQLFVFLLIFRCCLWALIFEGSNCHFKKSVRPTRQHQQHSIKKVIIARPCTSQQRRRGLENQHRK
jgi:hypothetical protein